MSRRKQSNPKPLKWDENWVEGQSGGGEVESNVEILKNLKREADDDEVEAVESSNENNLAIVKIVKNKRAKIEDNSNGELHISSIYPPLNNSTVGQQLPYFQILPQELRNDGSRYLFLKTECSVSPVSLSPSPPMQKSKKSPPTLTPPPPFSPLPRQPPIYNCEPCNIKFSNARTLEAHQTYYCSSRKDADKDECKKGSKSGEGGSSSSDELHLADSKKDSLSPSSKDKSKIIEISPYSQEDSNSTKNTKNVTNNNTKLYVCSFCSYSAEKKVSLNRHMRMHSAAHHGDETSDSNLSQNNASSLTHGTVNNVTSLSHVTNSSQNVTNSNNVTSSSNGSSGRYCYECEIQFSSYKTYRVHKDYYCSTRHQHLKSSSSSQPFVLLPTIPSLIVPYSFISSSSIVPPHLLPSTNALVILPDGSIQSLPQTPLPPPFSLSPHPSSSSTTPETDLREVTEVNPRSIHSKEANDPHIRSYNTKEVNEAHLRSLHPKEANDHIIRSLHPKEVPEALLRSFNPKEGIEISIRSNITKEGIEASLRSYSTKEFKEAHQRSYEAKDVSSKSYSHSEVSPRSTEGSLRPYSPTKVNGFMSRAYESGEECEVNLKSNRSVDGHEVNLRSNRSVDGHEVNLRSNRSVERHEVNLRSNVSVAGHEVDVEMKGEEDRCGSRGVGEVKNEEESSKSSFGHEEEEGESLLDLRCWERRGNEDEKENLKRRRRSEEAQNYTSITKTGSEIGVVPSPSPPTPSPLPSQSVPTSISHSQRSVWKCTDCDIVYYKEENYRVHKEVYCAFRSSSPSLTPPSSYTNGNAGGGGVRRGGTNEEGLGGGVRRINEEASFVGVRRGGANEEGSITTNRSEGEEGGVRGRGKGGGGWKCPCCDVMSVSISGAQKHLETHTGVRAFKCIICGYRGNTLRGMRTHIRMHFEKRGGDVQEGDYISCITSPSSSLSPSSTPPANNTTSVNSSQQGATLNTHLVKRRNRVGVPLIG